MISHVTIKTAPTGYPVSVEDIKEHAIIEHDNDDWLLNSYLRAAIAELDPPHGILGRAMMEQTLIAYLPGFDSDRIYLPYPPLISVTSVKYQDSDGNEQTVDPSTYEVITGAEPGYVAILDGEDWPTDEDDISMPVWIEYKAGYPSVTVGETTTITVPEGIRFYIMLLVAEMYRQRELSTMIATKNNPLWMNLIEKYRFRFEGWE